MPYVWRVDGSPPQDKNSTLDKRILQKKGLKVFQKTFRPSFYLKIEIKTVL
jgi:hypothetical protein